MVSQNVLYIIVYEYTCTYLAWIDSFISPEMTTEQAADYGRVSAVLMLLDIFADLP